MANLARAFRPSDQLAISRKAFAAFCGTGDISGERIRQICSPYQTCCHAAGSRNKGEHRQERCHCRQKSCYHTSAATREYKLTGPCGPRLGKRSQLGLIQGIWEGTYSYLLETTRAAAPSSVHCLRIYCFSYFIYILPQSQDCSGKRHKINFVLFTDF